MSSPKDKGNRRWTLASSASVLAAAAAALSATPAIAQDGEEEAIIVTGSRIPQPNLYTTSPVTQVTADDIQTQGVTRVEDLTNQLPQVFAAQGANVSNGATGTAQVNLRGLGARRTLVLIDGRRMGYGSPNSSPADLNQIPGALVERVEVLTGGASAVYGSDAVAGVVNFIMNDDFEGLRFDGQWGFFQHSNDYEHGYIREVIAGRAATNPAQFGVPEDNVDDGFGKEVTVMFGASTADDRGHVTAYLSYRNNDFVLQRDRDYSACTLQGAPLPRQSTAAVAGVPAGAPHFLCGGSSTSFPGRFTDFVSISQTIDQSTGQFVPYVGGLHAYNFGPLNYYQRPDERYSFGTFATYEVNDSLEVYGQAMFTDYRSVAQIAPSGVFLNAFTNCGNPLLPSNAAAIGCTPARIAADSLAPIYIGRRNVEGGGRQDDLNYESYRLVGGVHGSFQNDWEYDASATYSRVNLARTYLNEFSVTRLGRALNVSNAGPDGISGNGDDAPICNSVLDGTDANCVPYDIFTPGGVTQAALDYLQVPLMQRGETIQQNVIATVFGELPWALPSAQSPAAVSFGLEYRRDELASVVDSIFQSGDGSGQGGPTLPLAGVTDVFDLFGEARIPLVEEAAFAHLLSIDLAYRYSDYNSGTTTDTYKVGLEWAPVEDIRFRGSYQQAVRAPNIIELFSAQGVGLFSGEDPCNDPDTTTAGSQSPAACFSNINPSAQVTVAQSLSGGLASPAGQYTGYFGGNPNLDPESSNTLTIGLVFQPSFAPGLAVSLDYFDIEVADLISTTGAQNTLTDCYETNNPTSCNRIFRNPGNGSLWVGAGQVEDLNTNIGGLRTKGFDINADYRMDVGGMGEVSFQLVGTYLQDLIIDEGEETGHAPYDCAGFYSNDASCGTPNPEWRHRFRVGWETPWDVDVNLTWRYFGEVMREVGQATPAPVLQDGSPALDRIFDAENYFDVAGSWQVMENSSIRFGVNNVLDNDPPISFSAANGNTFPQVYDALGRWVFVGATVDF